MITACEFWCGFWWEVGFGFSGWVELAWCDLGCVECWDLLGSCDSCGVGIIQFGGLRGVGFAFLVELW